MEHALSRAFTGQTHAALSPLKIWDLIVREARNATMSGEDRALLELVREGAARAGAPLLAATSAGDLSARVEQVIASPELHHLLRTAAWTLSLAAIEQAAAPHEPAPEAVAVLGAGPARRMGEIGKLAGAAASVLFQMLAASAGDAPSAAPERPEDPLAFAYDTSLPVPVRRCLLQGLRADAYTLALACALSRRAPLEPWLALALVERLVEAQRDRVGFLASLPGVAVPLEIVPEEARLDLAAIEGAAAAVERDVQRWFEEAAASGQDVYFPAGDDEHAPG